MDRKLLMKQAKRLRVELVLLGMVLARDGDRTRILGSIEPETLQSLDIAEAIQGISDMDVDLVKRKLKRWGIVVSDGGTVLQAVLEALARTDA
jgi:hypothetical protein